jgi:hypothetical protein
MKTQVKKQVNALKHATKDRLAVLTPQSVFFSNLEGVIERHFPNSRFNTQYYTEMEPFPGDFEAAKKLYFDSLRSLQEHKKAEQKIKEEAQYAQRRNDVLNLWRWRKGELECYVVTSYKWVTNNFLNWDREDYEYKVFFSPNEAKEAFDGLVKENIGFDELGYNFYVELTKIQTTDRKGGVIDIPLDERLEITSIEEIYEEYMQHSDVGGIESIAIDSELPEDAVIVTTFNGNRTFVRRANFGERTGDILVRASSLDQDAVYRLSELSPDDDYHTWRFIIDKLDLTRKDCAEYLDKERLDMLFDEE